MSGRKQARSRRVKRSKREIRAGEKKPQGLGLVTGAEILASIVVHGRV